MCIRDRCKASADPGTVDGTDRRCINGIFKSAQDFLKKGDEPEQTIDVDALNETSKKVFNVFLVAGIIIAVLVGAVLGIKIMVASVEEQAKIKELMVPYIVGCIVIFSAFTIWKIVVTIGNQSLDESADNSVRFNQPIYMAGIKHNCDMIK